MLVRLVPSLHRAGAVPERDCDRFPAQPDLSHGSRDADSLRPWTKSSTTVAGGTEAAAGATAVAAGVAADPTAGGADAQLWVLDIRLNFGSNWSAPKTYSSTKRENTWGLEGPPSRAAERTFCSSTDRQPLQRAVLVKLVQTRFYFRFDLY